MKEEFPAYYRYWGKTSDDGKYHLLPYHCLDVAAVGCVWLKHDPVIRRLFALPSVQDEQVLRAWVLFFLAMHDFGKFDIRFQLKAPEALQRIRPDFDMDSAEKDERYYHGPYGWVWFSQDSSGFISDSDLLLWGKWMESVCGHHGSMSLDSQPVFRLFAEDEVIESDHVARVSYIDALEDLFLEPAGLSVSQPPPPAPDLLAGFCSVCDWIGSNPLFFKPISEKKGLHEYWETTLKSAEQAIAHSGILGVPLSSGGMEALYTSYHPRQVQTLVEALPIEPGLTLIEAPTGSGKTEAALAYASRLLAAGLADSVLFALPTQATANAMFERLEKVAPKLFPGGSNVLLAHGKAKYNEEFQQLKAATHLTVQGREEAAVQCVEWLSASRKRAFLGQIGVCTIDQVFLSVLPVRHQFVRAFGIRKSILIIDEVHAYDAYMYGLLENVLRGQQSAGGSVILLSATLPQWQKRILLEGHKDDAPETPDPYPLITHQPFHGDCQTFVPDSQHQPPLLSVKTECWQAQGLLPSQEQRQTIISAARDGALVGIVCNLVADAQQLAALLRTEIETANEEIAVDLFHARYRFKDRQLKEAAVMAHYGNKEIRKRGRILVATQVIEQSLDLDFDWMITQLCPVDLLFQRIGRLHRHPRDKRPAGFATPLCTVLVPVDGDYLLHKLIYGHTQVLWRTHRLLEREDNIQFPAAYRDWIERVYAAAPWENEPAGITQEAEKFRQESEGKFYGAKVVSVTGGQPLPDTEGAAGRLTRDGEMSLTVIPVIAGNRRILLDGENLDKCDEGERDELIDMNSIGVPAGWRRRLPSADDCGRHWLPMNSSDSRLERFESTNQQFIYSPENGLELMDNMEAR